MQLRIRSRRPLRRKKNSLMTTKVLRKHAKMKLKRTKQMPRHTTVKMATQRGKKRRARTPSQ